MMAKKCFKNGVKRAFLRCIFAILSIVGLMAVPVLNGGAVYADPLDGATDTALTDEATDTTTDANGANVITNDHCQSSLGGMAWLVCTVTGTTSNAVDWLYEKIEDLLVVNPVEAKDGAPIYEVWKYCRGLTNIVFIIFLLVVIYSQITGIGISNYGIKKALPKLIVVAVLVNLSFLICQLGIDLSNIVGNGLRGLFTSVEESVLSSMEISQESIVDLRLAYADIYGALAAGTVLAAGAAVISFESGAIWMLIPVVLGAIVAVASGLVTIALRQAVVSLLVMISPLAIVAYMLPNTENLFQKWKKLFIQMLVFYPMFSLLFGASSLAGFAIMMSANDGFWLILGAAVQVLPLFFSWSLMKMSGTFLGNINAKMRAIAAKPLAGSRAWAESHRQATKAKHLASGRAYTPSMALMQYLSNRRVAREAELEEDKAMIKERGLAYRAAKHYDKNGAPTKEAAKEYEQQARRMRYAEIVERDKNNMNKGLGQLVVQPKNLALKARLAALDNMNVIASDNLKLEKARGEVIEYENAKGFHKRMEDAIDVHFDDVIGYERDETGKYKLDANGQRMRRSDYKFHFDNEVASNEARARYAAANRTMEGNLRDIQYAAATAAHGYDTQKKIIETKMGKYFELTPPTKDVEYRLSELTKVDVAKGERAANDIDHIIAGLRVLNQRGDTDLLRMQVDNLLNQKIGGGIELGTHASQSLASFLMFDVKDNDPFLRRFGKYINLETAQVYNKNKRQNAAVTLDEYVTGEYEDWDPNDKTIKRVGKSKRAMATLMEGTSLDGMERTAMSNLDDILKNVYSKNGEEPLDVKAYLGKRKEIETAIAPAFISASLKYPSGSEQLKSMVSFMTGYNDKGEARWEGDGDLAGADASLAEAYFREKTLKYIKDQTPAQILGMRSDYKTPLVKHLVSEYELSKVDEMDDEEREEYNEYMKEKAEIQTRYGDMDAETAKKKRDVDMQKLNMEMAGTQMRRILGNTGKLKQIYKTRTSGAANGAKDWLREMVLLDDEQALRRDVAHYERKKREEYEKTHRKEADARDDDAGYTKVYDELDKEGFMAEMSNLKDKIRDEDTNVFYDETRAKLSGWFGEDDYMVWKYENWYKNNPHADNSDLYDFVRDLLEDLNNYPGNRDKK